MPRTAGRISYASTYLCSFRGTLGPPELIGEVPEGLRANFYSTGGTLAGERLRGTVRPVGGDWMTIRRDGIGAINVRTTFETHDGAAILVTYEGVVDLGAPDISAFA